ncbi:hypothetical protein NHX12_029735 [Muraenolepis orangiensis]|uniref:Uncharacterized protein n=1 Tax=Muraenolepis orangiensis TaxID=630683 RepID=A0A9Q0IKD2_9TELE|nr:hypothetical protein NHX12_029735 [Muraenolepis orangiensis]
MEKDFQSAAKRFWQRIRRLRRGKRGSIQAVHSLLLQSQGSVPWSLTRAFATASELTRPERQTASGGGV